ncbi:MAG: choice-of-anchor tandem repeat GloVer-containing protein, partial [Limisphaerales bacterium]
ANLLGLYWFTTQTNQTINGDNTVDIGYHYVAADTNGNPLATYDPNTPNYILYPDGPPTLEIITNPVSETVTQGFNASFSVTAVGRAPLAYQWYWNGAPLSDSGGVSGSGSATLNLNGAQPDQAGNYYVVVTNVSGSATSAPALLTVSRFGKYDTQPQDILTPYADWNITDISDFGQPNGVGRLPGPFSEPRYNFANDGIPPVNTPWHTNYDNFCPITQAWGTTTSGGTGGMGTVYTLDLTGPPEGAYPNELLLYSNMIYGTTEGLDESVSNGYGTIFSVNTNGLGFTNLLSFSRIYGWPVSGVAASGSLLYGTTYSGGNGFGTVFSFNATNGAFNGNVYTFQGPSQNDGEGPGQLLFDGSALYGTTSGGGSNNDGQGTVFEINLGSETYEILHNFSGRGGDGSDPEGPLLSSGGVLYGTTVSGGAYGFGTVFRMNEDGSGYAVLHSFGDSDGRGPEGELAISDGALYGTTSAGGAYGDGAIFTVDTDGTDYAIIHSFNGSETNDGAVPFAGLIVSGETLYGTTYAGGAAGDGTVFCVTTEGQYTNLYSFRNGGDGAYPATPLVLLGNTLFGTTDGNPDLAGDPNYGTIFSIKTGGGDFTVLDTFSVLGYAVLHNFSGTNGDGASPCSQLAMSGSAFYGIPITVYGTTTGGGPNGFGTVFRVNSDGTGFTNLYAFTGGDDGKYPRTGLLIDGNTLYGTTTNSIFKINTDGGDFICLTNINGASQLILSPSGTTLFGVVSNGGTFGCGNIFSINADGGGFRSVYSFSGGTNGAFPLSSLALYRVGNSFFGSNVFTLYGATYGGGANDCGMVFSINTDGSDFTDLHDFDGTNDGANPVGGLLVTNQNIYVAQDSATKSYLFGTTSIGGKNGGGTIWSIGDLSNPNASFQTLYSFGTNTTLGGANPEARLAFLGGALYGTTSKGGAFTNGMVFCINNDGTGFNDLYDFGGGADGGTPLAGLALPVTDNLVSIW